MFETVDGCGFGKSVRGITYVAKNEKSSSKLMDMTEESRLAHTIVEVVAHLT
ncbi:MAG: hypothetical protein HW407_1428 [Bacteroidetes bacterium]|nr:hypothetical protein [Bacteroidota bacterium]